MNTQKRYYDDSYITDFQANIIEVMPYEEKFALVLDQTYFYPESGGQPSDLGTINGHQVLYVAEHQGTTLHIVEKQMSLGPADCNIDWAARLDHMQQHSGQHILSACFYKLFEGETSSFHIGKDSSTIEIDLQSFDSSMAEQLEAMTNDIVFSNKPVTTRIIDKAELSQLPLRKQPQVDSNIRIVNIEDCDCTPCGGTHVKATGEIGLIKIKKWEKLKSSYKFDFVCGTRALKDYTYKNYVIYRLGAQLSAQEQDVENAFLKLTEDYKGLQKQMSQLRSELIGYDIQQLRKEALSFNGVNVTTKVFNNREFNDIKLIAQGLAAEPSHIALLATAGPNSQLIFARSENLSINMNDLLKAALPIINGKGGGSPKSAQGGGIGDIEAALTAALQTIKQQ